MDGAGAGGAARERRKQLTAAEAMNHKRQMAQMVERELALTGADSVTDFDDALQMVIVEAAFGRYPKHLLDVYTGADLLTKAITSSIKFQKFAKVLMGHQDSVVVAFVRSWLRCVAKG
eukprot:g2150.t1